MGNSLSSSKNNSKKEFDNFYEVIDYIATNYILTMDFKSLSKLAEKEYCDKLVILSSDIIHHNFNDLEVTFLIDRIQNGVLAPNIAKENTDGSNLSLNSNDSFKTDTLNKNPLSVPASPDTLNKNPLSVSAVPTFPTNLANNSLNNNSALESELKRENYNISNRNSEKIPELITEKEMFIDKSQLENISSKKKKYKCIGIAKYYVKIAHIFAAIITTISPVFRYKDPASGQMVQTDFLKKDTIPKNVPRKLYKLNICDNRISSLRRGNKFMKSSDKEAVVFPKMCSFNYNKNGILKNLSDEPGIKELAQLYYDDNYNYMDGTFSGMSVETKKQYLSDLKTFYLAFTENPQSEMPQTFSDIKLRDYMKLKQEDCQPKNGDKTANYNKIYTLSKNDDLFKQYGTNIKNMIQSAADKQQELLTVIDKLFYIEPAGKTESKIRVHPKLTEQLLQEQVIKTRKIIMELYVKCETDYVSGLKIYEAIVESKIQNTRRNQQTNHISEQNKLVNEMRERATVPFSSPNLGLKKSITSNVNKPDSLPNTHGFNEDLMKASPGFNNSRFFSQSIKEARPQSMERL